MSRLVVTLLVVAACGHPGDKGLHVGTWRLDRGALDEEATSRGVSFCDAAQALADEELIRVEYCSRARGAQACSSGDRERRLAAAIEDAAREPAVSEVAAVERGSAFLSGPGARESGLALRLAGRRATRDRLEARARKARQRVRLHLPAGCAPES